jgi:hypothetical protein
MTEKRKKLLSALAEKRKGHVLGYITGDRPGLETQIHPEVLDKFVRHLDKIGKVDKIVLVLHSKGGDITAAWTLTNLIRSFCKEFEVIIPARAHSAATLISLGADRIIMTKQATLGPIDPSINTPLNPQIPNAPPGINMPVSVEAIHGFLQLAETTFGIKGEDQKAQIMLSLVEKIHPLVLGNVYRVRNYIRMLARKLLEKQTKESEKIDRISNFLCSDYSSHDYTINRREARDFLGLNIEKPDDSLYEAIKNLFEDIQLELELSAPYNPVNFGELDKPTQYQFRRVLIESLELGTDYFSSEGAIQKRQIQTPQGIQIQMLDNRTFEGWKEEYVK